jgi:hypothetical protein
MVTTCQRCGRERPAVYLLRDQFWCAACLQEIGLPPDSAGGLRQAPAPCLGTPQEVATECQRRRERLTLLVSTRGRADGFSHALADLWAAMRQLDLGVPPAWPGEPQDALKALEMLDAVSQWCASRKGGEVATPAAPVRDVAPGATDSFGPLPGDITILTVLASAPAALTRSQIVQAASRLYQNTARAVRPAWLVLLGESTVRDRLQVLEHAGLVTRPLNNRGEKSRRKGVTITEAGRKKIPQIP